MTNVPEEIRRFWDADAATYEQGGDHRMSSPAEQAAWSAALARHLPPPPARVLDVGAGTGFVSLTAARLGHAVTALDLSSQMLAVLARAAGGLDITIVQGSATEPPPGPFDAVTSRHLLWTLPDPSAALGAWRAIAPGGRLLLLEGLWGDGDPVEAARRRARRLLRRALRRPSGHHADYHPDLVAALPLAGGTPPATLVELVAAAGWRAPRIERLRDVEWTRALALPTVERMLGVAPQYLLRADGVPGR